MLLSECNIQDLVTEQIKHYLKSNELSFADLKANVISKAPIPEVHSQCVKELSTSKKNDLIKVKKALETQAFKKQISDDEKDARKDLDTEAKDEEAKTRYSHELTAIPPKIANYENSCNLLRRKMALEFAAYPHIQTTTTTAKKSTSTDLRDHALAIEKINTSLSQYDNKINTLRERQATLKQKLQEINNHDNERKKRKQQINTRAQARAAYQVSGEVLPTLSPENRAQLTKAIQEQQLAIEAKYVDYVKDAETINFGFFLALLHEQVNTLTINESEKDALKICIKFMKQNLQLEEHSVIIKESLDKKKHSISSQILKLRNCEQDLLKSKKTNPGLNDSTKLLTAQNQDLKRNFEDNTKTKTSLTNSLLLLVALTFLFSIPLILNFYGLIPLAIAPLLKWLLVATPPALLLLTTISVGIAALVFNYKANSNEGLIKTNNHSIQTNNLQIQKNTTNLSSLEKTVIPTLKKQITKDELARDSLIKSLADTQKQAVQVLVQAKEIKPIPYSSSSILTSSTSSTENEEEFSDALDPDEVPQTAIA